LRGERLRRPDLIQYSGEIAADDFLDCTRRTASFQQLIGNDLDLSWNIESYYGNETPNRSDFLRTL
jgi:hypothetical protein